MFHGLEIPKQLGYPFEKKSSKRLHSQTFTSCFLKRPHFASELQVIPIEKVALDQAIQNRMAK